MSFFTVFTFIVLSFCHKVPTATQLEAIVEDVQTETLTYDIQFEQRPGSYLEIYLTNFTNNGTEPATLRIPLLTTVSDSGSAMVEVNPLDSAISGGTYTFALAEEPEYGVDLSIDSVRRFDNGEVVLDTITLIEDIPESILLSRRITVEILNDGFEFASTNANLDYSKSDNTIGAIFIEEATIKAYKSAPAGEVNITVKGNGFKDKVLHVADKIIQQ